MQSSQLTVSWYQGKAKVETQYRCAWIWKQYLFGTAKSVTFRIWHNRYCQYVDCNLTWTQECLIKMHCATITYILDLASNAIFLFPVDLAWIRVPVNIKGQKNKKTPMAEVTWKGPHAPTSVMSTGRMCGSKRELLWRQCTVTQKSELAWVKVHKLLRSAM